MAPRFYSKRLGAGAALLFSLWSVGAVSEERAQSPNELIQLGLEARRQGHDAEALELFQRAAAIESSPRARAQIGLAHYALGQWTEAELALEEALAAKDDSWIDDHRSTLEDAKGIVARHLAWLVVYVNAANALVEVSGHTATAPGVSLRLPSGGVSIRVSAPGFVSVVRQVELPPQLTSVETVHLMPSVAPSTAATSARSHAPPPTPTRDASIRQPAGWVLMGLGAAALGYGGFLGVRTLQLKSERDPECAADGCSPRGVELDARAREAALLSTISVALGAGLATGGAWLTLTAPRDASSRGAMLDAGARF